MAGKLRHCSTNTQRCPLTASAPRSCRRSNRSAQRPHRAALLCPRRSRPSAAPARRARDGETFSMREAGWFTGFFWSTWTGLVHGCSMDFPWMFHGFSHEKWVNPANIAVKQSIESWPRKLRKLWEVSGRSSCLIILTHIPWFSHW